MEKINLIGIRKNFGETPVLKGIDLSVGEGELTVLLGPSGCGKTTLLRIVAGLEHEDSGDIFIGGKRVNNLPTQKRKIAMVFQNYAVFPHMSVFANIAFGLRMQKMIMSEQKKRVSEVAELLHVEQLLDRYPNELSGGQRQRVAVARALAVHPEVLFMDEPLSNLDALLRLEMRGELRSLLKRIGATTFYVTHDQSEAMSLSDRIGVMQEGHLAQYGTADWVYSHPQNTFIGGFIGSPPMNFIPYEKLSPPLRKNLSDVKRGKTSKRDPLHLELKRRPKSGDLLGFRAEDVATSLTKTRSKTQLTGRIEVAEMLGPALQLSVLIGTTLVRVNASLTMTSSGQHATLSGQTVFIDIDPQAVRYFDKEGNSLTKVD